MVTATGDSLCHRGACRDSAASDAVEDKETKHTRHQRGDNGGAEGKEGDGEASGKSDHVSHSLSCSNCDFMVKNCDESAGARKPLQSLAIIGEGGRCPSHSDQTTG